MTCRCEPGRSEARAPYRSGATEASGDGALPVQLRGARRAEEAGADIAQPVRRRSGSCRDPSNAGSSWPYIRKWTKEPHPTIAEGLPDHDPRHRRSITRPSTRPGSPGRRP
jgi:hypothetical protein